jgi:hypothetical protein
MLVPSKTYYYLGLWLDFGNHSRKKLKLECEYNSSPADALMSRRKKEILYEVSCDSPSQEHEQLLEEHYWYLDDDVLAGNDDDDDGDECVYIHTG